MGLSRKRKQQLREITNRSLKSRKLRKLDQENHRRKEILRRQRDEEDFWDEYEGVSVDSSSDESSPDEYSSEEEELMVEGGRGDNIQEGLGEDDGGVRLEPEEQNFRPTWEKDAGGYLRGVRGCGSSATDKRERRRKRDLEKSASRTRSIVEMFSVQQNKNKSNDKDSISAPIPAPSTTAHIQKGGKDILETRIQLQTKAAHDLRELLRLKSQQMDKYGHVLAPKSNHFRRHQMVQSFLWMQLNKEKDNQHSDRQGLARIVAQSFNKRVYTGRKIIQWERSWMKCRKIPDTKAGGDN